MGSVLDLSGSSDSLDWILNRSDEEAIRSDWEAVGEIFKRGSFTSRGYVIKTNLHMVKKGKGSLSNVFP